MGLLRKYKLIFTQETVTDEGVVIKQKPPVVGQICESEMTFENMLIPEVTISEMFLQKLFEGIRNELHNPNSCLNKDIKNTKNNIEINEDTPIQTHIVPLCSGREQSND